jgi:hypothetical protein
MRPEGLVARSTRAVTSPLSIAARTRDSFSFSAGVSWGTGVACREGKLPELTERDTEPEGVREAMTVPASRDVSSVRGREEERRDDVANVGPRTRRRAQKQCKRGARWWSDDYMLFRVYVRSSCQVDVTGRAFLLVQPRRLAPHGTVKVDYRQPPSQPQPSTSFMRWLHMTRQLRNPTALPETTLHLFVGSFQGLRRCRAARHSVPAPLHCILETFTPTNRC